MAQIDVKGYEKDFLLALLEKMLLIRRFEEKAAKMYGLKKIGGFCHIYTGQEAVAVGAIATADLSRDYVLTAYRDHGHALTVGMEPDAVMAELYGKVTGCSKGKGGSMHMFDSEKHFFGGNGIVGAHIPVSAGVALKIKYNDEDGVVLCFFGDGAIHQGSFHETLNMASVWDLPVVYICENNQYGMGTDFRRVSSVTEFSKMAGSYNMKGAEVDGMNVLGVYEQVKESVADCRENGNAWLLNIRTYRYMGHSMSDPAKYRSKEELSEKKEQDPITVLQAGMQEADMLSDEEYNDIDKKCKDKAGDAVKFAEESDEPAIESLYEDVLAE
jgi:pyruvate dehydrogenase E1 component alpha subunit